MERKKKKEKRRTLTSLIRLHRPCPNSSFRIRQRPHSLDIPASSSEQSLLLRITDPSFPIRCLSSALIFPAAAIDKRRRKMHLVLEFGGGLELLCQSIKIHSVDVDPKPGEDKLMMRDLLSWVKSNLIKERPEMFMKGDSVRPGVLVLINDCDWELCGGIDTVLEEKDVVVFISTLHGG